jgi:predicted dithiol-disulfide oxidoreductase (DUF899 family)
MHRTGTREEWLVARIELRAADKEPTRHFMFGPPNTAGCPACSAIEGGFDDFAIHLANHDVMLWAVSRAPLDKLEAYKQRMGWSFPWASSNDSNFNFDFNVSLTEEQHRGRSEMRAEGDPLNFFRRHDE